MQSFEYVIQDELGIHARPAGLLVKAAGKYPDTRVFLKKGEDEGDMKKLFRVMRLGVKKGDAVIVTAEGTDEAAAIAEIREIFEENL